jgi:molybdopterin converting factor small subunit
MPVNRIQIEIEPYRMRRLVLHQEMQDGATLKDLLRELMPTYKEAIEIAFDSKEQKLTGAVAVTVNGRLIQALGGIDTRIRDGDVIALIPILADG